jgi:hypothetical protein
LAHLHPSRVQFKIPFKNIGVEVGGPLETKIEEQFTFLIGESYSIKLTCLAPRGIHFEEVGNLTAGKILKSIKILAAPQAIPKSSKSNNSLSSARAPGFVDV